MGSAINFRHAHFVMYMIQSRSDFDSGYSSIFQTWTVCMAVFRASLVTILHVHMARSVLIRPGTNGMRYICDGGSA
jgi:hypothetical protein